MIRNIIVTALRNLYQGRLYSLINIFGLALGLSCSLWIFLGIRQAMSYDRFHEDKDHIFVLQTTMDLGTGTYRTDRSGGAVGPALTDNFPSISGFTRHSGSMEMVFTKYRGDGDTGNWSDREQFTEKNVVAADSNFLEFFTFPVLLGNPAMALDDPASLVMTNTSAEKYFGDANPVGRTININGDYNVRVTAVVEDPPVNSTIQFDFLIPFSLLDEMGSYYEDYNGNPYFTFLYLDDPEAASGLDTAITSYLDGYQNQNFSADQNLLSLVSYHRKGESKDGVAVTIMSLLAVLILVIACINFMNLSTARYLNRTKEVGMRKVLGARRSQLIAQFIGETMIVTLFAVFLSAVAMELTLPLFNRIFDMQISYRYGDPVVLAGLLGIFLVTSLLAGSYPAFFLSSFRPVSVLNMSIANVHKGLGIRKILVIVQFLFAVLFIIASVVNYRQVQLMNNGQQGADDDKIVYFPVRGALKQDFHAFRQELMNDPGIARVSTADNLPRYLERGEVNWGLEAGDHNDIAMICPAGFDFDRTFSLEMEEGRFYSLDHPSDSTGTIVINRAVAKALGLNDPVGKKFYIGDDAYTIIGVMKNYNFSPLTLAGDKAIFPFRKTGNLAFVRINGPDRDAVSKSIEKVYRNYSPDYPFDVHYLDDFENPLAKEAGKVIRVIFFLTFFGMFISYLGLFGLSVYSTEQRTKEIGIRKSLGSSSVRVLGMIVIDFLKLILVSLLIAIPVSVLLMRMLLKIFSDRAPMGAGMFLAISTAVILLAVLTVGYQAYKTSARNPADSLRYE